MRLRPLALLFVLTAPCLAAGTLFSTRMDDAGASRAFAQASPGVVAAAGFVPGAGTIDEYRGPRSGAVQLRADFTAVKGTGVAHLVLPPFTITNQEADLAKLTLGFDAWLSAPSPIGVRLESLDAQHQHTGALETVLYPPTAGAFFRFTVDLSDFTPASGNFDPLAPSVRVSFRLNGAGAHAVELRVDNLSYTAPTFYVRPDGSDGNEGYTPDDAFATIQQAVLASQPGDVIVVMNGTYVSAPQQVLVQFNQANAPDKWLVLRAHPGHRPLLRGTGWNIIFLNPATAYVEIRDLTLHGYNRDIPFEAALADGLRTEQDGQPYTGGAYYNSNGISIDGRKGREAGGKPHHFRILNNTVTDMPGGGISVIAADHVTVAGNIVRDNCHAMRYAGSGISLFRAWDFDDERGYKFFVLANQASGNRCYVPWPVVKRISDGNGIIIDDFINYQLGASEIPYEGRTLVQNNLTFNNGGSGIHTYAANHVDVINNTAYHNAQSPVLDWRQIWAGGRCHDIRLINNLSWAQSGKPVHTGMGNSTDVLYAHNLMYGDGGNERPDQGGLGTSSSARPAEVRQLLTAHPRFIAPSVNSTVANFRLLPDSPAIDAGLADHPAIPLIDLDPRRRPVGRGIDLGAYEGAVDAP